MFPNLSIKNGISLFAVLTIASSCGKQADVSESAQAPVVVKSAMAAASRDATGNLLLTGSVEARQRAEISTRVMGTITSLRVEEGQSVSAGQVLGQIRSNDLQAGRGRVDANIREAEAVLANAKRDLERFEALFAQGSATQKELDDVRTGVARAQAQVDGAKQARLEVESQLGYATLVAPFAGFVTHKYMQVGGLATPGMPILTVEGGGGYKLVVRVPEQDVQYLKVGQLATVTVDALVETFDATVQLINPSSSFSGAQYEVTLLPKRAPAQLKAGMYVRVVLPTGKNNPVATSQIWVPDSALVHRGDLTGLYVVSPKQEALLRWVRLGGHTAGKSEILAGLSSGESYVLKAFGPLKDGQPVTTTSSQATNQ